MPSATLKPWPFCRGNPPVLGDPSANKPVHRNAGEADGLPISFPREQPSNRPAIPCLDHVQNFDLHRRSKLEECPEHCFRACVSNRNIEPRLMQPKVFSEPLSNMVQIPGSDGRRMAQKECLVAHLFTAPQLSPLSIQGAAESQLLSTPAARPPPAATCRPSPRTERTRSSPDASCC